MARAIRRLLIRMISPRSDVFPAEVSMGSALTGLGVILLSGRDIQTCGSLGGNAWGLAFLVCGGAIVSAWLAGGARVRSLTTFSGSIVSCYAVWVILLEGGVSAAAWMMAVVAITLVWSYARLRVSGEDTGG